jgi:hypothetical protein
MAHGAYDLKDINWQVIRLTGERKAELNAACSDVPHRLFLQHCEAQLDALP